MNYLEIRLSILGVFREREIDSFPIDCYAMIEKYGLKHKSYNSQSVKKKEKCLMVSDDAFTLKKTVFYNDDMPTGRIRFSLMHELGHLVLNHTEPRNEKQETEANYFASNILAPRMAIHYAKCKNLKDVSKAFGMTYEAADYAFQDYRRWHRRAVYKMSELDKAMYMHFYSQEHKCFIFSTKRCESCGELLYNHIDDECESCKEHDIFRMNRYSNIIDSDFLSAERSWLYGGL